VREIEFTINATTGELTVHVKGIAGPTCQDVTKLAEEFLERYRRGERPPLREYIARHPELAAEIKEVFPAMAMMENIAVADESLDARLRVETPIDSEYVDVFHGMRPPEAEEPFAPPTHSIPAL